MPQRLPWPLLAGFALLACPHHPFSHTSSWAPEPAIPAIDLSGPIETPAEPVAPSPTPQAALPDPPLPSTHAAPLPDQAPPPSTAGRPSPLEPAPAAPAPAPPLAAWPIATQVARTWDRFYAGDIEEALADFQRLTSLAPDRADVHYGLGRCLISLGRLDEARTALSQALRLSPRDLELAFYLGVVDYQAGQFAAAVRQWEALSPAMQALLPSPLTRDHAWLLARAYLALGDTPRGLASFRRALTAGGQDETGRLLPPPLLLEHTLSGQLPGEDFQPLGGLAGLELPQPLLVSAEGAICLLRGNLPVLQRLTNPPQGWRDSHPVAHPRGEGLFFLSTDRGGQVSLVYQPSGGDRTHLSTPPLMPVRPTVAPDGSRLVVVALTGEPPSPQLMTVSLPGGSVSRLLENAPPATDPSFTPRGTLLFVQEQRGVLSPVRYADARISPLTLARPEAEPGSSLQGPPAAPREPRTAEPRGAPPPPRLQEPWEGRLGQAVEAPTQAEKSSTFTPGELARARQAALAGRTGPGTGQPVAPRDAPSSSPASPGTVEETAPEGLPGEVHQPVEHPLEAGSLVVTRQVEGHREVWLSPTSPGVARRLSPKEKDCFDAQFGDRGGFLVFSCREEGLVRPYLYTLSGAAVPGLEAGQVKALYRESRSLLQVMPVPLSASSRLLAPPIPLPAHPGPGSVPKGDRSKAARGSKP